MKQICLLVTLALLGFTNSQGMNYFRFVFTVDSLKKNLSTLAA